MKQNDDVAIVFEVLAMKTDINIKARFVAGPVGKIKLKRDI